VHASLPIIISFRLVIKLTDRRVITSTVWTDDHMLLQASNWSVWQPRKAPINKRSFLAKLMWTAGNELGSSIFHASALSTALLSPKTQGTD